MVSMTGSTARPTAQTPRRAVSELPHLCVRLCFFCSHSHSHSHWHSHFFSNVAHTHTHTRTCAWLRWGICTYFAYDLVLVLSFESEIGVRVSTGFLFFCFFLLLLLLRSRFAWLTYATAGSNVTSPVSPLSLSLSLPFPLALFLCCFVVISVKSFQLSRTQHRYCNRIRSGKRIYRLWTSRIRSVWPQGIYCCAALQLF